MRAFGDHALGSIAPRGRRGARARRPRANLTRSQFARGFFRRAVALRAHFLARAKIRRRFATIEVDQTVYTARPNPDGRPARETAVYDLLEKLAIPFARVEHGAAMTIADCHEVDALLGVPMCKNLFLRNGRRTEYYLLLIDGAKTFHTKELSAQIGASRLSFAEADAMEEFLGVLPGSVTVLGLMNDTERRVRLLVDADVLAKRYIGCHPCVNTASVRLTVRDLLEKFLPAVGHEVTEVTLRGDA